MAHIILPKTPDLAEKLSMMREDARFDVGEGDLPLADAAALRGAIRSRAALPKVPKVFLTNDCAFNCAYCGCREGRECGHRYVFSPRELADIAYRQSRQGGHGIFLSSAIHKNPDYTQELIARTLEVLRRDLRYGGYIHAKVMPGADPLLIRQCGRLANRLSVNIEVAKSEGYARIARNKNKRSILTPMGQISDMIQEAKQPGGFSLPRFATTQTTQMMAGSTGEDDFTILNLSGALYRKYRLSRVYYTAFHYEDPAKGYEALPPVRTPAWRMHRLYQADRLMQEYGFTAPEIAPEAAPYLAERLDPKAAWALRNLHLFPLEVNREPYEMLLRIPGIGPTYAQRIVEARRLGTVTHDALRALGVRLDKSRHFLSCGGRYEGLGCENPSLLYRLLADAPQRDA